MLHLAARGLSVEVHLLNVRPAVRGVAASLVSSGDLEDYHRDEGMKALAESMQVVEAAGLKPHAQVKDEMVRFMAEVAPAFEGTHRDPAA